MQMLSWGATFFVMYSPMLLGLVLLVGAGIIYTRVRSPSTAAYFFGSLVASLAPWAMIFVTGNIHNQGIALVTTIASAVQTFGLLFYALSIPKRIEEN
jgi:hypothetical protein